MTIYSRAHTTGKTVSSKNCVSKTWSYLDKNETRFFFLLPWTKLKSKWTKDLKDNWYTVSSRLGILCPEKALLHRISQSQASWSIITIWDLKKLKTFLQERTSLFKGKNSQWKKNDCPLDIWQKVIPIMYKELKLA